MSKQRAILVLGMHRSGTSALTRVLNVLGAELGPDLVEPGSDNPDGFWEHARAVALNEKILADQGRTWYDMREMAPQWTKTAAARRAVDEIEALVRRDFSDAPLWALKDPRVCLTAPLWIEAIRRCGIEPDCVFMVRNPREVVESLHVRNRWMRQPLYLMWVQYLLSAVSAAADCSKVVVTFDQLLDSWREVAARISEQLGLPWPLSFDRASGELDAFLQPGKRHFVAGATAGAADNSEVPSLAAQLYDAFRGLSEGDVDWSVLGAYRAAHASFAELYASHLDDLTHQRWDAEGRAVAAEERLREGESGERHVRELAERLEGLSTEFSKVGQPAFEVLARRMDELSRAVTSQGEESIERIVIQLKSLDLWLQHQSMLDPGWEEVLERIDATLSVLRGQLGESQQALMDQRLQVVSELTEALEDKIRSSEHMQREDRAALAGQLKEQMLGLEEGVASSMRSGFDSLAQAHGVLGKTVHESVQENISQLGDTLSVKVEQVTQDLGTVARVVDDRMDRLNERLEGVLREMRAEEGAMYALWSELQGDTKDLERQIQLIEQNLKRQATEWQNSVQRLDEGLKAIAVQCDAAEQRAVGGLSTVQAELKGLETWRAHADKRMQLLTEQSRAANADRERLQSVHNAADAVVADLHVSLEALRLRVDAQQEQIDGIFRSRSWRITAPLRAVARVFHWRQSRQFAGRQLKRAYDSMPVHVSARMKLKGLVFRILSPLLRSTNSYKAWREFERHRVDVGTTHVAEEVSVDHDAAPEPTASVDDVPVRQDEPEQIPDVTAAAVVKSTDCSEPPALAERVLSTLLAHASKSTPAEYVELADEAVDAERIDVRAIAFYLPQFHPIPENDEWWGRGFTEWTNVSKAVPQFVGHYQPRLPGELGFYDLRVADVMRRQVELARHYGVHGFCFHYYWFGGRRLLERPLNQFLANKDIDFPFCICWANENWTRRWDGMDKEVLVAQHYSPEDDLAFIEALKPLLTDPRYIRVDGRPLVVMYRPSILPDARATLERWRAYCRDAGVGELFICMVQFDVLDPREFGFDAAIEFPPHKLASGLECINDQLEFVNSEYSGYVVDYQRVVQRAKEHPVPQYDMIRGVFPSWDNEARKPGAGYTFANASPAAYRDWLGNAVSYSRKYPVRGESLVFINAWNEWAEGAYLEPDRRFGYAYLEQTGAALSDKSPLERRRVVIVSHDAHPHGAQYLALNMAKRVSEIFGYRVDIVLLGEGPLKEEFSRWARVHDLSGLDSAGAEAEELARCLFADGARHAVANTTVSGRFAGVLKAVGFNVIGLVHELPGVIRDNDLHPHALAMAAAADRVVFPADLVRAGFEEFAELRPEQAVIRPQGLYKLNRFVSPHGRARARKELRERLGVPASSQVVLGVGYADLRKGVDLFVEIARRVVERAQNVHFVWVGHFDTALEPAIREQLAKAGLQHHVHFPGRCSDTDTFYAGADVYALTSREDPYPSVVMEALQVEVPVVGFEGAGGFTELLGQGCGKTVAMEDVDGFAVAIEQLLDSQELLAKLGSRGRELVEAHHSFRSYLFDLLDYAGMDHPRVSVIVPNYNYADHLQQRLGSIIDQTYPFYELIVLDDASNDDSLDVVEQVCIERAVHARVLRNANNSGSVFKQWARGVSAATGDLIWIAEADDLCEPDFLGSLVSAMRDRSVTLAYSQSKQINESGDILAENYLEYTDDVSPGRWNQDYRVSGLEEIHECLVVKNTIPNVSAVLFRRDCLQSVLDELLPTMTQLRVAGDWVAYMGMAERGDVAFVSRPLNLHRRHAASVTLGGDNRPHMLEVLKVQQFAAGRYGTDQRSHDRASRYAEQLFVYFGFDDDEVQSIREAFRQEAIVAESAGPCIS